MIAIENIAISASLESAKACFYGESKVCTDTPLIPRDTPENRAGVSAQTQCPCGFAGGDTSDTPDTCQKTEVKCRTQKEAEKWASMM